METQETELPVLDGEEIRVLGALIEKSKATPEYYPMTINGLTAACNQKTSRRPIVNYDEQTVSLILDRLKRKRLAATVTGGSSRTIKYKHNLASMFTLPPDELAVVCLLLLRGPQTPGELNTNSGRLYEFDDLDEVLHVLDKLSSCGLPFVTQLPKQAGQKEARFMHLLGNEEVVSFYNQDIPVVSTVGNTAVEERLSKLEEEFASLKMAFDNLYRDLNG